MANKIDTKSKRDRLAVRREPYWAKVQLGGYVGFRSTSSGGTWIARFRSEDGKQNYHALTLPEHLACNEYDAAVGEARKWFESIESGVRPKSGTVSEAANEYLESLRTRKGERALADAKGRITRYIYPSFGNIQLSKITTKSIETWLFGLVPKGVTAEDSRKAKVSANRNLTTFKAILNKAHKNGAVVSSLPWERVESFQGVNRARKEFLSRVQLHKLLAATDGGFHNLVKAAALTGARYGELRALRAQDVDLPDGVLHITEGKTGARIVPLTDDMSAHFSEFANGKQPEEYLFTRDNGRPWGHSDQDELMREAVKKAELPNGVVFYTLRHSFIAFAIGCGMDIYSVAEITGTSIRMIEDHYGKLLKGRVRDAMTRASILSPV